MSIRTSLTQPELNREIPGVGKPCRNHFGPAVRILLGSAVLICAMAVAPSAASQVEQPSVGSIQSLIRSKQIDQALSQLKRLLKKSPNDVRLWTLDGVALSMQGRNSEAIVAFEQALAISPGFPAALMGEVQLYYQTQDQRAVPLLQQLIEANPQDATGQEMLATMQGKQGNCEAADTHFALIANSLNKHPASLEIYGGCLLQTRRYDEAIATFRQLASLLPAQTFPRYNMAVALFEAKRNVEALEVLERLMVEDPSDSDILSLASDAYEQSGETPKAVTLLRQAIVLAPSNASYYNSFAALCLDHESFQPGVDMINAGLQRMPNEASLYISRGMLFAQLAQYDQAEADFKKAELLDPGQSVSLYAIDLAELQRNNPKNALAQVRVQLKAHPESALLCYLLAKLLSTQGAETDSAIFDEAAQSALLALKINPNMTESRDLLATMYTHSGRYDLAVEQCRLALKTNPRDQTAIYHLIVALRHTGQGEQRAEIQELVRRLADLQKESRQNETDRKRFRFETSRSVLNNP